MQVFRFKKICPKCKREYDDMVLGSYSSGFENYAKDFVEHHKSITHCEDCNIKLVQEHFINYFDDNGNYSPKLKVVDNYEDSFDLYLMVLEKINHFFYCVDGGSILLSAKIERNDENASPELLLTDKYSAHTTLLLTGKYNDKEYQLLSANLGKYQIGIGDRKNRFMIFNLAKTANLILSNIYDYIFFDDCNSFDDKEKEKISKKEIDIGHF